MNQLDRQLENHKKHWMPTEKGRKKSEKRSGREKDIKREATRLGKRFHM
jgi:hypothetical protein